MTHAFEVTPLDEFESRELEELLVDRIYEFNAKATGYSDGMMIGGCVRTPAHDLVGGYSGHTWGGCCVITHLWVAKSSRGQGLGRRLLQSAESEAARRHCANVVVATHGFQAPGFYERMGYARVASIADWPMGHSSIFYRKVLRGDGEG